MKFLSQLIAAPVSPLLFATYPVLFAYTNNRGAASAQGFGIALSASIVVTCAIWLFATRLTKCGKASALWVCLLVVIFFGYGHVHLACHELAMRLEVGLAFRQDGELQLAQRLHIVLSIFSAAVLVAAGRRIFRLDVARVALLNSGLNAMGSVLVILPLLPLAWSLLFDSDSAIAQPVADEHSAIHGSRLPDIYEIILDGYGRHDVLQRHFSFDNSPFQENLSARGFQVLTHARANYAWTFLSLASFLNLHYIDHLEQEVGSESTNRARAYVETRNNDVLRFLAARGYRSIHLQSTWGSTLRNPYVDHEIPCGGGLFQDEFLRLMAETTLLSLNRRQLSLSLAQCHLNNLTTLETIAGRPGPKYVFAHFVPPHHPYLFDPSGNVLREARVSNQFEFDKRLWHRRDLYIDQLAYMNQRVESVIEAILAQSATPPIILLHADHGPQLIDARGERDPEYLFARFATFVALHLPDEKVAPNDLTLVNMYRWLFRTYFDADLDLLPDRFLDSRYMEPLRFSEIRFGDADDKRQTHIPQQELTLP